MSLRGRISRLGGVSASPAKALELRPSLDDLRERMAKVLARSRGEDGAVPLRCPPDVDFPELPFVAEETEHGVVHVRTRRLSAAHRIGRAPLSAAAYASPEVLALLAQDPDLGSVRPRGALYLDTETTGLSGGTGTVAFLVGLAFFRGGWVLEQLLVRELGEEVPMLARVAERIRGAELLVTFNGKSFDVPLLRTRFAMARMELPPEPPHLDLVHVARRLHKARGVSCKLTSLEEHVLGFVRLDDVPSGEVSAHYLHFLRTGDTRGLVGVVDHNGLDVETMIALVGLYGEPLAETSLAAPELVGLARTLRQARRLDEARGVADRAVERGAGVEAFRARAEVAKAAGDKARALADFEIVASEIDCKKTRLELAKLYEHHVKAPARALEVALSGTGEGEAPAARRRERLEAKLEKSLEGDGPLFTRSHAKK